MDPKIFPIPLPFPFGFSEINCYLLRTEGGFFLVDTGYTNSRRRLMAELNRLGCNPGNLLLVILTHGDFDHTGNAVYLRQQFGTRIAMHRGDLGMLEAGDMFWNRKFEKPVLKKLMRLALPFNAKNRGKPDDLLEDGASLAPFGLQAQVINTPGHSTGSICILTNAGDLFCGDLFTNSTGKPELNRMLYDRPAGQASFDKLKVFTICTVYPGHGKPFEWDRLV